MNNLNDLELKQYYQLYKKGVDNSRRFESCKIYQMDVKFLYHVVRLLDEVEQILITHDIDLQQNREQLKSIRRGEWKMSEIEEHFLRKEKDLETLYTTSTLQHKPDEKRIQRLLMNCLEEHYGDISTLIKVQDPAQDILKQIQKLVRDV